MFEFYDFNQKLLRDIDNKIVNILLTQLFKVRVLLSGLVKRVTIFI